MAKVVRINATLKDATAIRKLWESVPDLKAGSTSLPDFLTMHEAVGKLSEEYARKEFELTGVKGKRDDKALELQATIVRFRGAVLATYGNDSTEYQQAGLTRARDRKPPKSKVAAAEDSV
jgi:hypothetical protein